MLKSRIIPCLLVHKKGLVKTLGFGAPKYVGDPINAVKIFNEKEVDELMVIDIDATVDNRSPDFEMIKNIAVECRMPFCYGGGVKTVEDAKKIISLGAEKIALSSSVIFNLDLINDIGAVIGAQSVVLVLDVKKRGFFGTYEIFTHNGKKATGLKLKDFLISLEDYQIGELVINSIEDDGKMKGFDFKLFDLARDLCDAPLTILGGAGHIDDIKQAIERYSIIGVSAGSLFVFKGKYKAVLINYPSLEERKNLY